MNFSEIIIILKRLYREYVKKYFSKIILSLFLSIIVAASTSATAWLLDPAVKKIFIDKDQTLSWLIPICIIIAFSSKGISLYIARVTILKVGHEISGLLQKKLAKNILYSDVQTLENRHSGKYVANIMFDAGQVQQLVSTGVLNIMKDTFTLAALLSVMFYQNWKLSLFALIMMPLSATLAKSLGKRVGKAVNQAGDIAGNLNTFLQEDF